MTLDDIDLVEINEAFASVVLAWGRETGADHGQGQRQRRRHRPRPPARRHRRPPDDHAAQRARAHRRPLRPADDVRGRRPGQRHDHRQSSTVEAVADTATEATPAHQGARPDAAVGAGPAEGLRKVYGERVAVDDVGFSIARGETYGLLGPNGAGKTTTISIVCGLLTRDAGEVTVAGRARWAPGPRRPRPPSGWSPRTSPSTTTCRPRRTCASSAACRASGAGPAGRPRGRGARPRGWPNGPATASATTRAA